MTSDYDNAAPIMSELGRVNNDLRAYLEKFRVEKQLSIAVFSAMLNFEAAMYQRTLEFSVTAFHQLKGQSK